MSTGLVPGRTWRFARVACQALVLLILLAAPLLGGWQRLDRNLLATWDGHGWDLPAQLLDRLPLGEAPSAAFEANQLLGGGTAGDWFGLPAIDPVAGLVALAAGEASLLLIVAFLLPLALGLVAGRFFCGWLCPFGTVSRLVQSLLERLPWRIRQLRLPDRRPVRWVVLLATIVLAIAGIEVVLYLVLPHALMQQSVYAIWLMGGGGAALGWLLGLLLAGVFFGPTAYCSAVCPTGAALSVVGRARRVRITLAEPSSCGRKCHLCNTGCWLGLDPASGDPGPDCDTCTRCFASCPRANMRVTMGAPRRRNLVALLVAGLCLSAAPAEASEKPRLLLHATHEAADLTVAISVVDLSEVRLDADAMDKESATEITVFLGRGERGPADSLGREPFRDSYAGPLDLVARPAAGPPVSIHLKAPTAPASTGHRKLYRQRIPEILREGDVVELAPVPGWTTEPLRWEIPRWNPGREPARLWGPALAGFLFFAGLLSLVFAVGSRGAATPPGRAAAGRTG